MSLRKVALITGASAGFGAAIAKRLANEGYALILMARRADKLSELAAHLGAPTHLISCDLRDEAAVRAAIANIPAAFASVDVLVNNAGLALGLEPAHKADWNDWQQMIDTNCTALALMTRLILPGMVERQKGHVITMGSIAGAYAYPGGNAYGATKAFVEQFARNLRADVLGSGVRVTNIEPGLVGGSEFSLVRFKGDAEKAASIYKGANALQPEDIAESVAWVLAQPAHVNINSIELMPVSQAHGPLAIHRQ